MNFDLRLERHPADPDRAAGAATVTLFVNGQPLEARRGESLATALWANGILQLGGDGTSDDPRGMFCGIGHCYACRVTLDGVEDVRSCLVPVREGMQVNLNANRQP